MKERYKLPCNIAQTLNIVGDRWTLLILHDILIGHQTFNELKKNLEGISANLLSDRLKHLEKAGLVETEVYTKHPPRYQYKLTESGRDLEPVFDALLLWGRDHLDHCYKKMVHSDCQHEVELSYYCPSCKKTVDKSEINTISTVTSDLYTR
ncbi:winged helix-turn-helix transcriptional regulator [Salipaludibacillus aurantiacus]|uniref:DNA-binding transcriptional regulator, HxlR family n=1 Tax=Salipaludibacillus aurantiacus TaxID=1601833 RepID=A0A1H9V066_9BACI|nr:helix-turn-helix domain-containing protein [Salipaludibacillus aurantiacus]SES15008.1 DNA-binding transcriptional regulator, HxlR family [Salipaludibacillus aurantiacus]